MCTMPILRLKLDWRNPNQTKKCTTTLVKLFTSCPQLHANKQTKEGQLVLRQVMTHVACAEGRAGAKCGGQLLST